jgi:hypothetical protein
MRTRDGKGRGKRIVQFRKGLRRGGKGREQMWVLAIKCAVLLSIWLHAFLIVASSEGYETVGRAAPVPE